MIRHDFRPVKMRPGGLRKGDLVRIGGLLVHVDHVNVVGPFSTNLTARRYDAGEAKGRRLHYEIGMDEIVDAQLPLGGEAA